MMMRYEQAQLYCTPGKAKKIIVSLLLFSLNAQAVKDIVWYQADVYTSIVVINVYLVLFIVVLPLALLVLNMIVVREVRRRSNGVVAECDERPVRHHRHHYHHHHHHHLHRHHHDDRQQQQQPAVASSSALSAMLVATSLMHVAVCATWFSLCYVYLWTRHPDLTLATRTALHEVFLVAEEPQGFVMCTAFCVYFIRGKQFRAELRKLLCRCRSAAAATTTCSLASPRGYAETGV